MGGKPNPTSVKELSEWLRRLDAALTDKAHLDEEIAQKQKLLEGARARAHIAKEAVEQLMREMDVESPVDVESPGNYGYEGRRLWLLRALNKHAEEYGRLHP